jgi:hypothetical protein
VKTLRWLAATIGLGTVTSPAAPDPPSDQAVIVRFNYGSTDLSRLFELERKLEAAIAAAKAGEYDGNEVAVDGSDGILYMYGPSADRLFQVVEPILKATPFMDGAKVEVRYGPPADGVREKEITIVP